jgi:intraflagellar transport protein 46
MNSDTMPTRADKPTVQIPQKVDSRHSSAKSNTNVYKDETPTSLVKNQPFDEVMETFDTDSEAGSVPSPDNSPQHKHMSVNIPKNEPIKTQQQPPRTMQAMDPDDDSEQDEESDEEGEESGDDEDNQKPPQYNPAEYSKLQVAPEVRELFAFITAYKAHDIELESKLKPFIPGYTAAVGDTDPFLKVARPDGKEETLGLKVLDEPAAKQSDPAVVQLSLNYASRDVRSKPVVVNSIENAEKNPKKVQKWIDDIRELHRTKPPPSVHYSKPMPDIEFLMQAWPDDFEEALNKIDIPNAEIDLELEEYARIVCAILDIPVYANVIESLHVLFSLFLEFKQNAHFSQQLESSSRNY